MSYKSLSNILKFFLNVTIWRFGQSLLFDYRSLHPFADGISNISSCTSVATSRGHAKSRQTSLIFQCNNKNLTQKLWIISFNTKFILNNNFTKHLYTQYVIEVYKKKKNMQQTTNNKDFVTQNRGHAQNAF